MGKGLDALERLYCAGRLDLPYVQSPRHKEDYELVEKELKALEIIKNKNINIVWLKMCFSNFYGLESYNRNTDEKLYREQYELLKEVLEWHNS